ncbi:MAG: metal-dependent transcriptional regulator [Acidobacteria bacterium]|nr:MAG: metal-dependent transcriptional regulator [Acidobacteriota bacterium]
MADRLSPSMEMYLKTILSLEKDGQPARVQAIASALDVKKPSVSGALHSLKQKGLVVQQSYGAVHLTEEGRTVAKQVTARFEILKRFLSEVLGVDATNTSREACELEHVLCSETVQRLHLFLDFLEHCNLDVNAIMEHFQEYLQQRLAGGHCPNCELKSGECGTKPADRA